MQQQMQQQMQPPQQQPQQQHEHSELEQLNSPDPPLALTAYWRRVVGARGWVGTARRAVGGVRYVHAGPPRPKPAGAGAPPQAAGARGERERAMCHTDHTVSCDKRSRAVIARGFGSGGARAAPWWAPRPRRAAAPGSAVTHWGLGAGGVEHGVGVGDGMGQRANIKYICHMPITHHFRGTPVTPVTPAQGPYPYPIPCPYPDAPSRTMYHIPYPGLCDISDQTTTKHKDHSRFSNWALGALSNATSDKRQGTRGPAA
jgi:hypothetical protein